MRVRIANGSEKAQAADILKRQWGEPVVVRGRAYMFDDCQLFLAGDMAGIAAVSHDEPPFLELVAINAFSQWKVVGSALIEAIAASASGAVDESRRLKPSISTIGQHGIPIHDELDLVRRLR